MREIKLGVRVPDVVEAAAFYVGLGFEQVAVVPGPAGQPVLAVLRLDGFHLIVDALVGLPFPDSPRERMIQSGPRGLGCVIGIEVADLQPVHDYCAAQGAHITSAPQDQPWGERTFTCVDPFGYEWKFASRTGVGSVEATQTRGSATARADPGDA